MQNKRLPQLLPGFLLALLALLAGSLHAPAQLGSFAQIGGNKVSSVTNNGGGSYTIVGGGNDIWDQRDEFAFAYTEVTGDFDARVRVDSLQLGSTWTKAGLMARESLSEFSRMAFPRVTPDTGANDTRYAYRTGLDNNAGVNGGQHEDCTDCEAQRPGNGHRWVRLVRTGSVFDAYSSPDGSTWVLLGSQNSSGWGGGNMANTLYLGLAVSRHSGPATVTAQFSSLSFNYGPSFSVAGASSRGNPNGIHVTFSKPPGASALTAANYAVSGGVTVTSVSPGVTLNSVRLNTSGLTEGSSYTVTVSGVQAADSTALSAPTTATFTHGAGYEARSIRISHNKTDDSGYYRGSDGALKGLGDVLRMANGNVFAAYQTNSVFEDPIADDGGHERFSTAIAGVFVPPTTGNYTFYCSSDDVGYLFLSTDDLPANRVQIATEPQWNGRREYINGSNQGSRGSPASNISGAQSLVAGRKYYLEYIYTEGGGGNNGSVAVLTPGGAPIANGSSPVLSSLFTPARQWDGQIYYTLGAVSVLVQPVATTVQSPNPASFSVRADGTPGYTYQWQRRGSGDASFTDVPGATGSSYTLASTVPSDNQAQYRCVVRNEFSEANSAAVVLTVLTDTTPPTLISAINVPGSSTSFDLTFSEPVDPNDAVDLLNYTASSGITLTGATIQPGNRVVRFTCTSLVTLGCTTLTVSNVRDASNQANPIAPGSTIGITYAAGGVLAHRFDGIGGVSPGDLINNAAFPNSPSVVATVGQFEYAPNVDNYGARLMAFLSPPVTGPYTFYVAADDGASLWLSTDISPANKVLIANEPVWAASRQWTGQAGGGGRSCPSPTSCNISAPITLQGGCKYYIEMIFKEGGGGDHGAVAWRTPATGPSPNVPANGSAPIPGTFLSPFLLPATVTTDIADRTIPCGSTVTFTPTIIGTPPLTLQWYENGVAIPGATGPSYTTRPLTEADSGVKYYLEGITTDPAGTARTTEATVTVVPDPVQIVLLSASGSTTFDAITLVFNKTVDQASAADTISYLVTQVGGGPLGINSATVLPDGKTVVLGTTPQTPDTLYSVTVNGNLFDFCGTPIVETNVTIRSFVIGCGTLVFETYPTGGGTAVSILTGHPSFPNNPDSRMNLNSFDTRAELGTDNYRDNYGGRVRGIYYPPASGNYQFFIHSDDASQLFLNPTGPSAAGKVLIAEETGCCRDWPAVSSSTFFPAGIPLMANQPYYIEGLFKEGGGGDYIRVAARLVGSSEGLVAIGSNQLGRVSPAGNLGTVSITQQPASRSVQEGDLASFSIAATTGTSPNACYQWRRDGIDIPGATTPTLSIGPVSTTDNGAVFSCVVSMPGSSATSQDATLTVVPRTGGLSCGFLVFESYECGGGTAVSRLTGSPLFPGSPRERLYMTSFDTRTVYPNDSKDNYGARIRGYFIPPTSGNWILYLRSDDASQLFLSPSMDPAAKVMITEEPGCCAGFGAHASAPIPLVGGQAYYIEALYKEGGGGDYCQVAAKLENDPTIPDTLRPIPGAWLAAVVDSEGASLAITSQPQSTKTCLSLGGANPETVVDENFGSGDGGGAVADFNGPFEGPWTYNGARGTWTSAGQGPELGRAPSTRLTFGPYNVTKSGNARLSFEHRYSFEGDYWDGGQVRVSVNGGPFVAVPSAAFLSGGYNGSVNSSSSSELNSQPSYVLDSPNYGSDQFITSVADLGVFLAGDTIRVQFVAAYDTNTRQGNPAWEVTSLGLTAGIGGAAVASFNVGVNATGPGGSANPPVYIQWQRNCSGSWIDIPGAGGSTYTFSPRLADNGCRFRAIVCIPGGSTMSSEATLTVVQPNTPPSFVAPATFQSYEDAATVVSGFLSNLQPDSIDATEGSFVADFSGTPTPVIFTGSSFDSLPPGAAMIGSAYIGGGRLHLTDALNSQFGALLTGFDPNPRDAYTVSWTEYVGGGTCCGGNGADGYSLNIATDLQLSGFPAEEGTGTGVSLLFDTWDNGGGEAPAINLKWQGNIIASAPIDVSQDNATPVFRPVSFSVTAAGRATLSYNGNVVFNNVTLPGWAPQSNLRILLGARTGGANDNHHIDDMALTGLAPVLNVPPPPPAGSVVYGSAYLGGGVLHITDAINGASGAFVVDDLLGGAPLGRFTMNFDARVGGGTAPPADGFAVSIANNLPAGTWPIAEEGEGNGLSVCFDIFDNGGGEAPAIDIKWQGNTIAHTSVPSLETGDQFVPVSIKLDPDGTLDLIVAGTPVYTDLVTGYVPINGAKFGIGGRTGGLNANQWIDNLNIQASAVNPGDAEASQTITVTVTNDNPALFQVQPAISSDGTLTYTPAANACGSAKLTIVARDNGGTDTDCGGRDTAEPVDVTLNIVAVNDCPVPAPLSISVSEGGSAPVVLSATDADANGCGLPLSGFTIVTQPLHGTLSGTPPNLVYTPGPDYPNVCGHNNGADSFTYAATDGQCVSTPVTVTITVVEVNDCPTARINNGIVWRPPGALVAQTVEYVISANGSNAVVILDGSLSSDVECDPLTYAWYLNGSVVPYATSVIATNVLALGQHQIQLVVDDATCVGMATITLEVLSPGDAVDLVIDEILNSNLERREQRPLISSLKVAIASFERDGAVSGINQLNACLNKIRAQISQDYPAESALWTAQIESIIAAVRAAGLLDSIPGQANR